MKEQPEAFSISWHQARAKVTHHRRGDDSMDGDFRGVGSLAMHGHSSVQLLAAVMQCVMQLGRAGMAVRETWEIQKAAKLRMRAKRSVSW